MSKLPKRLLLFLAFFFGIAVSDLEVKKYTYPLYGNVTELLYYYANIYVGSPPQQQSVIVDTGSSFVGVPCQQSCSGNCGKVHRNALFDAELSQTFAEEPCAGHKVSACDCSNGRCKYQQVYWFFSSGVGKTKNISHMQREVAIQDIM